MADPVKPALKRIREKLPWRKSKISTTSPQILDIPIQQKPDTSPQPTKNADSEDDQDPWRLAYNEPHKENPELIEAYGLSLKCIDPTSSDPLSSPESTQNIVSALTKTREDKQWTVALGARQIKVRAQVEKLVRFALGCNSIIGSAAKSQPYAALAWSGVTACLQLLSDGLEQAEIVLAGFNYTCDKQRYWRLWETSLQEHEIPAEVQEPLIKLYAYILKYQATVIFHLSKRQAQRAWNFARTWEEMRLDIERQDELCQNLLTLADRIETRKKAEAEWKTIEAPAVQREIKKILDLIRSENQSWRDQKYRRRLLEDLSSDCDYEHGKNLNPPTVAGTCEWFFNHEDFKTWRDMYSACILWLSAGPGCGKSVLSRALIDDGRLTTKESTSTICYFFFKEGDPQRITSASALSAMLHQLFTLHPDKNLINCALDSHNDFGKNLRYNFHRLWNILLKCAEQDEAGEIICLIDALAKCKEKDREELINNILQFYAEGSQHKPLPRLKLLVIGRPYERIDNELRTLPIERCFPLELDSKDTSEKVKADITLVIQTRTNKLLHFDDGERGEIVRLFQEKENRTYLWFTLMFNIIEAAPSTYFRLSDIRELLAQIPPEIDDAYEHILAKAQNRRLAMILFQIVLVVQEPLNIRTLNAAITLAERSKGIKTYEDIDKSLYKSDYYGNVVRNLSGLFFVIQEDKVHFIHQTAREFLLSTGSDNSHTKHQWKGGLNMEDAHSLVWTICSSCLKLCPDYGYWNVPATSTLSKYASEYWQLDYERQNLQSAHLAISDAKKCCIKHWKIDVRSIGRKDPSAELTRPFDTNLPSDERRQELFTVIYHGAQTILDYILKHDKPSHDGISYGLQVACNFLRPPMMRALVDCGASTGPESYTRRYIPLLLCYGYESGYLLREEGRDIPSGAMMEAINILKPAKLDLEWQNSDGETILHIAVLETLYGAIGDLANLGMNLEIANNDGETALHAAAKRGSIWRNYPGFRRLEVGLYVNRLLEKGAKVNAENLSGRAPLGRLLNSIGEDAKDDELWNAEEVVDALFEYDADKNHLSVLKALESLKTLEGPTRRFEGITQKIEKGKDPCAEPRDWRDYKPPRDWRARAGR